MSLPEQDHQLVLRKVRVLVLVHEHVLEAFRIVLEHVVMFAEHPHRANQQVVEVHRVRRDEAPLVLGISLSDPPLVDCSGALAERRGVDQVRLGRADDTEDSARRESPLVDVEVVEDVPHEPAAVAVVVDREAGPIADPLYVAAQHSDARGVERGHPHPLGIGADEFHDAAAHLVRGLVGEGDGEDAPRRHTRNDEASNAASQHASLAGAGAGHHDKRAAVVQDRFALGRVQVPDQACDRDRHRLRGLRGILGSSSALQPLDPRPTPERGQVSYEVPILGSPCAGSSRGQRRHHTRHYRRAGTLHGPQPPSRDGLTPTRWFPGAWTSRRRRHGSHLAPR